MKKLYDCRVRLAGLVHHEVPKYAVTEKEIILLRTLHGADAVVGIKSCGEDKKSDREELQRLAGFYGAEVVEKVFQYKMEDLTHIEEETETEDISQPAEKPLAKLFDVVEEAAAPVVTQEPEKASGKIGAAALNSK